MMTQAVQPVGKETFPFSVQYIPLCLSYEYAKCINLQQLKYIYFRICVKFCASEMK